MNKKIIITALLALLIDKITLKHLLIDKIAKKST